MSDEQTESAATSPTWCLAQCQRCGNWSTYEERAPAALRPCHVCGCATWRFIKFQEHEGEAASRHLLGFYRERLHDTTRRRP